MRVAFLTTSYPEKNFEYRVPFIKLLYDRLEKEGIDLTLISPQGFRSLHESGGLFPAVTGSIKGKILFFFYTLSFLFAIIRKTPKCDLIHANWSYTAFLALLTQWIHHKKILLTERLPEIVYTKNIFMKLVVRWVYHHVDQLVVISSKIANDIHTLYHIPREHIHVIPNGVHILPIKKQKRSLRQELHINPPDFLFLYVGRLIKRKGVDLLLRAFRLVPQGKLYLIGSGPELPALQKHVATQRLRDRVIFLGDLPPSDVFRWMKAADVFVFPSLMETGGNVLLEAAASGLPIITTDVGWARDVVIPGKNGLIIPPHAMHPLTRAMRFFLRNRHQIAPFCAHSKKMVRHTFTWKQTAHKYILLYQQSQLLSHH